MPHSRKWPAAEAVRSRVMNKFPTQRSRDFFCRSREFVMPSRKFQPCYSVLAGAYTRSKSFRVDSAAAVLMSPVPPSAAAARSPR